MNLTVSLLFQWKVSFLNIADQLTSEDRRSEFLPVHIFTDTGWEENREKEFD